MPTPGHQLTVHEANSGARVPICSCGWIGEPFPIPRLYSKRDGHARRVPVARPDVAVVDATRAWRSHIQDVQLGIAAAAEMGKAAAADLAFRRRHP